MHLRTSLLLLTVISVLGPSVASAQRVLPYQGRLDRDGAPLTGKFDFKFELHSGLTGDCAATPKPASCLWDEEVKAVDVKAGRFSVSLGAQTAIPDAVWLNNPEVYLAIRVAAPGDVYAALAGRQRILAAPTAVTAAIAKNYSVTQDLTVSNNATIGGTLSAGKLTPSPKAWAVPPTESGIVNDPNARGTGLPGFMLVGRGGAVRKVSFYDDLKIPNGRLDASRGMDLGLTFKSCLDAANDGCFCPAGSFPINYAVSCYGSAHGVWGARLTKSAVSGSVVYGASAKCYFMFNPWPLNQASRIELLCAKVTAGSADPSTTTPWNF